MPRLILLNGLPGVGKSTLAGAYVATRPGVLNLDIDVLRTMLGGQWEETAELGRSLALRIIEAHLESGHDVVVPQLVANPDQLGRFDDAAADFDFVMVLVQGESRLGDQPWQQEVAPKEFEFYRQRFGELVSQRPDLPTLQIADGEVDVAVEQLDELLGSRA
ncbi:AAA family ATPase [Flexivirga sp. B27]